MRKLCLNGEEFVHFDDVLFINFDKNRVEFDLSFFGIFGIADMTVVLLGCI